MKKLFALAAYVMASFAPLHAVADAPAADTAVQEIAKKDVDQFTVEIPQGWIEHKEIQGIDAMFLAPPPQGGSHSQANVNIISGDLGGEMSLDGFYSGNIQALPSELKEFKKIDNGEKTIHDIPGKWIHYSHKVGDLEIDVLQYFFVVNDKGYVVTFSALSKVYPDYEKTFDKIIATLQIKKV